MTQRTTPLLDRARGLGYEPGNSKGQLDTLTRVAISQFQAEPGPGHPRAVHGIGGKPGGRDDVAWRMTVRVSQVR